MAGDLKDGKTTTLCVRRATYWCPELKADDPAKKGVCSNYLRDSKPGDEIKLTGPSGKVRVAFSHLWWCVLPWVPESWRDDAPLWTLYEDGGAAG